MIFQRRTIVEAMNLLEAKTNADIDHFTITYEELTGYGGGTSKRQKINNLTSRLTSGKVSKQMVFEIIAELIENELSFIKEYNERFMWETDAFTFEGRNPKLNSYLRQDGFNIVDYKLVRELPEAIASKSYESELFVLLDKYDFSTCRGHLEQAIDTHGLGKWAAANAQMRFDSGLRVWIGCSAVVEHGQEG